MTDGEALLAEKYSVRQAVSDLVTAVLWNPQTVEATCDTMCHHIRVWRDEDCIRVEVRKVH